VLEIGGDLAKRNEFIAFVILLVANPGLQSALDVYHCCWWVDPPGGRKGQRRKRPKQHHADDKPSNKGSQETRPKPGLGVCVRDCSHISE